MIELRRSHFSKQPMERRFLTGDAAASRTDRSRFVTMVSGPARGVLWRWAAAIATAAIAAATTRGSGYHQLAIGLFLAIMAVAVGLAAIELIWRNCQPRFWRADLNRSRSWNKARRCDAK